MDCLCGAWIHPGVAVIYPVRDRARLEDVDLDVQTLLSFERPPATAVVLMRARVPARTLKTP
jgi:hypothetical protein